MGWSIELVKDGNLVVVPAFLAGSVVTAELKDGELVPVETTYADISVTYNYSGSFNFWQLANKSGRESLDLLAEAVGRLGVEQSDNYWDDTPGNCGYICNLLLKWAALHPDAVWRVRG
jgi:hypothetical protein